MKKRCCSLEGWHRPGHWSCSSILILYFQYVQQRGVSIQKSMKTFQHFSEKKPFLFLFFLFFLPIRCFSGKKDLIWSTGTSVKSDRSFLSLRIISVGYIGLFGHFDFIPGWNFMLWFFSSGLIFCYFNCVSVCEYIHMSRAACGSLRHWIPMELEL